MPAATNPRSNTTHQLARSLATRRSNS